MTRDKEYGSNWKKSLQKDLRSYLKDEILKKTRPEYRRGFLKMAVFGIFGTLSGSIVSPLKGADKNECEQDNPQDIFSPSSCEESTDTCTADTDPRPCTAATNVCNQENICPENQCVQNNACAKLNSCQKNMCNAINTCAFSDICIESDMCGLDSCMAEMNICQSKNTAGTSHCTPIGPKGGNECDSDSCLINNTCAYNVCYSNTCNENSCTSSNTCSSANMCDENNQCDSGNHCSTLDNCHEDDASE